MNIHHLAGNWQRMAAIGSGKYDSSLAPCYPGRGQCAPMKPSSPLASEAILEDIDRRIAGLETLAELSDERYHATHDDFEAASNQRELIIHWLERWADSVEWPAGRRCDVLSVGCGGGTMDARIADVFSRHADSLGLAGVDPNPQHTKAFAECFADRADQVTVATSTFENFRTTQRFDVIHFVHCLYYFEALTPALERAMSLLKPGGWLLVLQAPNEALNGLADRLWRKQWSRSAWYSDDVLPLAEALGGNLHHERIEATVDVTACLDPDDPRGGQLLDFIAQTETGHLDPALQSSLRDNLGAISTARSGRRMAPHPVDAIAVQRQAFHQKTAHRSGPQAV